MGIVKFGGGVAAISGKVAGNVYARNRAGAYIRKWAKPVNAASIRQQEVRAAFGENSSGWGALTDTQRTAWNALAAASERLNRLGDSYVPTGRQIFIEANQNLATAGETLLTDPPSNLTREAAPDSAQSCHLSR